MAKNLKPLRDFVINWFAAQAPNPELFHRLIINKNKTLENACRGNYGLVSRYDSVFSHLMVCTDDKTVDVYNAYRFYINKSTPIYKGVHY